MEPPDGIEPSLSAYETLALPLDYGGSKAVGMIEVTPLHPMKLELLGGVEPPLPPYQGGVLTVLTTVAWRPREESNPSLVAYKTSALSLSYRAFDFFLRVEQSQREDKFFSEVEE